LKSNKLVKKNRYNKESKMENELDSMFLKSKPDAGRAMERLQAWLNHEILDRIPVFHKQDEAHKIDKAISGWESLKARWFDSEDQVNKFIDSINNREFLAESFPVFSPNLGTDVYAAFYGIELEYADETSYAIHAEEVAMLKQISKCIK